MCKAAFHSPLPRDNYWDFVRSNIDDKLCALADMHLERHENADWTSTLYSPRGAMLIREAAAAERKAVSSLGDVVETL